MIVTGETAFLILRARSYMRSTLSELERADTDMFFINAYVQLSDIFSQQETKGRTPEQVVLNHLDQLAKSV